MLPVATLPTPEIDQRTCITINQNTGTMYTIGVDYILYSIDKYGMVTNLGTLITLIGAPRCIYWYAEEETLWITSDNSGYLTIVNGDGSGETTYNLPVGIIPRSIRIYALSGSLSVIYVSSQMTGEIYGFFKDDPSTWTVTDPYHCVDSIEIIGTNLYAIWTDEGQLLEFQIDPTTGRPTLSRVASFTFNTGSECQLYSPDGINLYMNPPNSTNILFIDTTVLTVSRTWYYTADVYNVESGQTESGKPFVVRNNKVYLVRHKNKLVSIDIPDIIYLPYKYSFISTFPSITLMPQVTLFDTANNTNLMVALDSIQLIRGGPPAQDGTIRFLNVYGSTFGLIKKIPIPLDISASIETSYGPYTYASSDISVPIPNFIDSEVPTVTFTITYTDNLGAETELVGDAFVTLLFYRYSGNDAYKIAQ
jgi:hypothetical protein